MALAILDKCLKLTINVQIRLGITFLVVISIIISLVLLVMSNLIQFEYFTNYYENIIQNEDNKMLLNYEQYIHTVESTIEKKAKNDLEFFRILETMYLENLEDLELSSLSNNGLEKENIYEWEESKNKQCFDNNYLKCIIYKHNEGEEFKNSKNLEKMINYYNLIFPLINSTLSENCIGVFNLKQYHNFQFYKNFSTNEKEINILFFAGTNQTKINETYNDDNNQKIILSNILDNLLNLFVVIPSFNKKLDLNYIISNLNQKFLSIPQITSKHISDKDENIPYIINKNTEIIKIKENDLSFESKIFNFEKFSDESISYLDEMAKNNEKEKENLNETISNLTNIFKQNLKDLIVIKWSDRFFENLINDIFRKNKRILNIFPFLFSPYDTIKENIVNKTNFFFDDTNGINLTKDILEKFSCMFIIKKELAKNETDFIKLNSFNITKCKIKFDEDFEEYLQNNQTEIDIYERKKVKVDLIKYDIEYIYFFENGTKQNRRLNFDLSKSEDQEIDKNKNSFKIYQGIYPLNSINMFTSFLYNNIMFINFYFSELFSNYLDIKSIQDIVYTYFFQIIFISRVVVWGILLAIIIIIVLKISHSISDPIDKLIQPVPMNDNSSRELNKYFQNISYTDDSTINDLFVLCKKLIIGGFKSEEDYKQKKKNKMINSYNNISLVKTNNMIINEEEIMKGVKKQEINFFEKQKMDYNIISDKVMDKNKDFNNNKFNCKVLSEPLFTGKFYQNNKRNLIKDKEYFDLLNNEMISQKKKNFDDNKSKGTKNSFISFFKEN